MAKIDLSPLSREELEKLIKDAGVEIVKRQKNRVMEARDKAISILEEYGVMADEIMKVPARVRSQRPKAPPKYVNPKNTNQTWAGRGRKPVWLISELKKKGVKLEDFAAK